MLRTTGYAGKYIGGYYISLELASSSSSRVFLGESVSPDRQNVVIKRLYALHIASRTDQERFLQEANLLKQLKHPFILSILSADILKGTPYIVSDYAPNGTLRDRLQRQMSDPMDQNEALTILSQVGQALHYAHEKNRVHGDLKPQNIFFNEKGDALLGDFKFASLSSFLKDISIVSPVPFTYTAPEQIDETSSKKGDQYALACIAYEMFTDRKPFTTPSIKQPGTFYKTRALIPPTKLNPTLPIHIEQAILKAMEKDPEQRHQNVLEFLKALGIAGVFNKNNNVPKLVLSDVQNISVLPVQAEETGKPLFPGLKVAPAGAMTLAQFSAAAKAALFKNTLTSLAGFAMPRASTSKFSPLADHKKSFFRRPFLIIIGILLSVCIIGGTILATSPYNKLLSNTHSTQKGTITQAPQGGGSGTTKKTVAPQQPTNTQKRAGGIILPVQPNQPTKPTHNRPTQQPVAPTKAPIFQPTQPPRVVPTPTSTTPLVATLSVNPVSLNAKNCTPDAGSYICNTQLVLSAGKGGNQNWYTYSTGVAANFNPSSGTIMPGQTVNIQISVFNNCTKPGTFVFVSTKTNVIVTWNC